MSLLPDQRHELLLKGWMSHDGYWYRHVAEEFGPQAANRLNLRVCRDIGRTDMYRLKRALGVERVEGVAGFLRLFDAAWELYAPPDIEVDITIDSHRLLVHVNRCFAHENVTRAGMGESYDCGIFERISGWLDALDVEYEIEPPIGRCLKV